MESESRATRATRVSAIGIAIIDAGQGVLKADLGNHGVRTSAQ